jgi:hypothetical protein
MTPQDVKIQALQLPISDRWRLVQTLLGSIQQETSSLNPPQPDISWASNLDQWTQSLMGVIHLDTENLPESYVDYLE